MTDSFAQFETHLVQHYAKMAANPATRDYTRQQVRDMERDHPQVWAGLEAKVRAAMKSEAAA